MKTLESVLDFLMNNTIGKAILAFVQGLLSKLSTKNPKLFTTLGIILTTLNAIALWAISHDLTIWGINLSSSGFGVVASVSFAISILMLFLNITPTLTVKKGETLNLEEGDDEIKPRVFKGL